MLPRDNAQTLLEALNYFSTNGGEKVFGDIKRTELFAFLRDYFNTDDLGKINYYLDQIATGKITSTTIPQDLIENAKNNGLDKDMLLNKMERQNSMVKQWVKSIQDAKTQARGKEKLSTSEVKTEEKKISQEVKAAAQEKEEIKVNNIEVKITDSEVEGVSEADKAQATAPFRIAADKAAGAEGLDAQYSQPALVFFSKGITSEALAAKAGELGEGGEKTFLLFTAQTVKELEELYPEQAQKFLSINGVKDFSIRITDQAEHFGTDTFNLYPNENGIFIANGISSYAEGYADSFYGGSIDMVADNIVSNISSKVASKIMASPIGIATSNFVGGLAAKMGLGAATKAGFGALGGRIGAALGNFGVRLASFLPALGGKFGAAIGAAGAQLGATLGSWAGVIGAVVGAVVGFVVQKVIQPIVRWIKENKEALLGMAATGGILGLARRIGGWFLALFTNIILPGFLGPLIWTLVIMPIAVVVILFIINSGAYITPPPFSSSLKCGIDYENLPFPDTSSNPIAKRAYDIVAGGEPRGLHRGFWCYWNKSPQYPELFDEAAFKKDPFPCVADYRSPGCTGNYSGLNLFWCTQLIIKTYNETGKPMPEDLVYTPNMKKWFIDGGRYIAIKDALQNISGQIKQGDAALIRTSASSGADVPRHVAIVWSADSDSIITIDSNGYYKHYAYTVSQGKDSACFGSYQCIIGIGKQ